MGIKINVDISIAALLRKKKIQLKKEEGEHSYFWMFKWVRGHYLIIQEKNRLGKNEGTATTELKGEHRCNDERERREKVRVSDRKEKMHAVSALWDIDLSSTVSGAAIHDILLLLLNSNLQN